MTSDYDSVVPGSISKEGTHSTGNYDDTIVYAIGIWAVVSLLPLGLILVGIVKGYLVWLLVAILILWWRIFIKHFRSKKHIQKSILYLQYLLRVRKGEDIVAKYAQPLKYIAESYPVKNIHSDGLVEYYGSGNPYGVLLNVDSHAVTEDELKQHHDLLGDCFNSLPQNVRFSVLNSSYEDSSEEFIDHIRSKANAPELSLPQRKHLLELHNELTAEGSENIDRSIMVSIIFDNIKDLNDARITRNQIVPGIQNELAGAGLNCFVIEDKPAVIEAFRKPLQVKVHST